ncbi:hypothetical protein RHODGE_RHODGE_00996 [Rhodoplanes serenus]|uniref:Uncharacterized protein n=1 Tax=Rhodoplanes serenus TaxID=200615 RepID=A0A447CRK6_9BRAD|nr:hypothetical protein [Rhodoplanes serenus]VCU06615.1 hypothetical protein RHODPL_RHODPL_00063 [Rhodoplanes serenus]VCU07846.1 hypothetical protein RHODGE_RHODGE_00996 [Rhodoplanes serenus]
MTVDRLTFHCVDCKHPVVVDGDNPPNDDDILVCQGCGRAFGTYAGVKQAMIEAGKREINEMVDKLDLPPWIARK